MAYQMRRLVFVRATTTMIIIIVAICGESDGRELRPSNHGLEYQESPPPERKESPGMMSFFAGDGGGARGSSPASDVALPKALNSSDASWWSAHRGRGAGEGRDHHHVRRVLLVASVLCGVTGVALLLASAFLYLFRHKKQQQQQRSSPSTTSLSPPPPLSINNGK